MKTTYTRTLFHSDLTEAKVDLYLTKENKYTDLKNLDDAEHIEIVGLKKWTVVEGGAEADAVETIMDDLDENREYLILEFTNGKCEFYRNSHAVMFIL